MIRNYRPGDEDAQVAVYNTVAANLPAFQPAKVEDIRRRLRGREFDADLRFVTEVNGQVVGYCNAHPSGRISIAWCLPGYESFANELFQHTVAALQERGIPTAIAAYRRDWTVCRDFLLRHDFVETRQMVNYLLPLAEMPTLTGMVTRPITPLEPADIPALHALARDIVRVDLPTFERHLMQNPHFGPESIFVMRSRVDRSIVAAGLLIEDQSFADPSKMDAQMPCFRLGAFGTEGMTTKRTCGLFSFIPPEGQEPAPIALDFLTYAVDRLADTDMEVFAAQAASDAPRLIKFYDRFFHKQGSFPVFERKLTH